jgi:hypothetical protein
MAFDPESVDSQLAIVEKLGLVLWTVQTRFVLLPEQQLDPLKLCRAELYPSPKLVNITSFGSSMTFPDSYFTRFSGSVDLSLHRHFSRRRAGVDFFRKDWLIKVSLSLWLFQHCTLL